MFPQLSSDFGRLGHSAAILLALAKDPAETICTSAVQAVSCLYKILFSQKEPTKSKQKRLRWAVRRSPRQSKEKACPSAPSLVQESIWHMAKGPEDQLFSTQLTSLLLAVLDNLRGSNTETLRASEEVLHAVLQNHARKVEQVKEVVAAIYTCLQAHPASFWVRKVLLKALGYLLPFHLEEVVCSCLSFSIPVNRQARQLWTAMASGPQVAMQVLQILLKSLQVKDPQESNEDILAVSLAAMNVIYECFGIPDYRPALMEMQAQLFIPMLSQVCCVRRLALPKDLQARQEDIMKQDPKALTFRSTSVEIIKGLFSLGKDWAVYARIEFQAGWTVLDTPGKFLQGTRLLARAMMECDSPQIRGVFSEAVSILNNEEDEMKKVTALALMVEASAVVGMDSLLDKGQDL
ncbi:maestro heat-like repeat-containing protein family member 1 [Sceloporus undulatus]|uniref:maestro heat-like repeat-containing protein family member 1 n=1 Tax=Sceloporus undulatus TaxID=8520 RepID=UPI001C4BA070|nr:maestro heat-like repeat-containing protein family member 1 [Sceloporus undulatus]